MSPKLLAALLTIGILLLAGGAAYAATLPTLHPVNASIAWVASHRSPRGAAPVPAANTRPHAAGAAANRQRAGSDTAAVGARAPSAAAGAHAGRTAAGSSARATLPGVSRSSAAAPARATQSALTYTVKHGDTVSGIAEWSKLHGYGELFAENRAVIGSDSNLILPGERITVRAGVMSVRGAAANGRSGT